MADQTKIRLGGLWRQESRSGEEFLSGPLGGGRLLVFENKHRKSDREPTHVLYLVPNTRPEDGEGQASNRNAPRTRRTDPLPSDAPGTERFEIQPCELDDDGLEIPF
jgi:hypothetical protein